MTARVYDLLDIMHPEGPDVLDGPVRLSLAKGVEPEQMEGLVDMNYQDLTVLLEGLAQGGESYRLRVEFETKG